MGDRDVQSYRPRAPSRQLGAGVALLPWWNWFRANAWDSVGPGVPAGATATGPEHARHAADHQRGNHQEETGQETGRAATAAATGSTRQRDAASRRAAPNPNATHHVQQSA